MSAVKHDEAGTTSLSTDRGESTTTAEFTPEELAAFKRLSLSEASLGSLARPMTREMRDFCREMAGVLEAEERLMESSFTESQRGSLDLFEVRRGDRIKVARVEDKARREAILNLICRHRPIDVDVAIAEAEPTPDQVEGAHSDDDWLKARGTGNSVRGATAVTWTRPTARGATEPAIRSLCCTAEPKRTRPEGSDSDPPVSRPTSRGRRPPACPGLVQDEWIYEN